MGIHGVFKEIGPGQRLSLAKLSSQHYATHSRPFRLAIDISIWLFQIQSGKGGSNPALRTFYYRLLRLISLNIHPLFVFDGPNKPLFKRNKKVGGPGVRVATVPEFLAKQLLKQFGLPWHIAPGEAEAECASLQREGIVDAVLSEDVDTLMFGSDVTLKNWTPEGSTKTPTHVNVYRAAETKEKAGLDGQGMILVALMSGGDYTPEGIPGCGPKVACDAARAGFGRDLCMLGRKDRAGLQAWRERLQLEIRTNQSKFFTRRSATLIIPDDFPNQEVLGYYTHPCISNAEKLAQLRQSLTWDQEIDYPALRSFTADAFDWNCLSGAKKFIRNLAPVILTRDLRLQAECGSDLDQEAQEIKEKGFAHQIHGKRNHFTTDGELELRISFTPCNLVPVDLSVEEEDDQFLPAGVEQEDSDAEVDLLSSTSIDNADREESAVPASPSKKRIMRPYDPSVPEKLWILRDFLKLGCPLLVEDYEASQRDPKVVLKNKAKAHAKTTKKKLGVSTGMPANALMRHMQVVKAAPGDKSQATEKDACTQYEAGLSAVVLKEHNQQSNSDSIAMPSFKLPSTQLPAQSSSQSHLAESNRIFAPFAASQPKRKKRSDIQHTPPRHKRHSPNLDTPRAGERATIDTYFGNTPKKATSDTESQIISLLSSSPVHIDAGATKCLLPISDVPHQSTLHLQTDESQEQIPPLPDTVTKRRRRGDLVKSVSAPIMGEDDNLNPVEPRVRLSFDRQQYMIDTMDLATPSPKPAQGHCRPLEMDDANVIDLCDSPTPTRKQTPRVNQAGQSTGTAFIAVSSLSTPLTDAASDDDELPALLLNQRERPGHARDIFKAFANSTFRATPIERPASVKGAESSRLPSEPSLALSKSTKNARTRIQLRLSLEGAWKEVDEATALDLTGDGSGAKAIEEHAKMRAWRRSGVEVMDLTGL